MAFVVGNEMHVMNLIGMPSWLMYIGFVDPEFHAIAALLCHNLTVHHLRFGNCLVKVCHDMVEET